MNREVIKKEIKRLKSEIKYHGHCYYVLNTPEISDKEYDRLVKKLKKLESELRNFDSGGNSTTVSSDNPIPERIRQYINKCKERLIDLSRRNRLLYFTPSKRSTLKISCPSAINLFNQLVIDEKSLEIWLPPEESSEDELDSNGKTNYQEKIFSPEEIKELNIREDQIVCNLKDRKEIEQTLKNIYRRASSDYRERGVRVLYIAFGLLNWKEVETSENVSSPLILVPVELKRESIRYPFTISPIGEDIILNPALKIKLQNDFKVSLPDLPDEWEEQSLQNYFNLIEKNIANIPWSIVLALYIGIFSFYKLVMYHDLDTNAKTIASNNIISSLGEGILQKDLIISDLPTERELDNIQKPIETFQVLDADSSQQLCIQYALRGQSFVIQGPPGTGKSQTIANIVAEFISRGRKVLFVSEKMAALEVVYKRLKEVGLSDFCLELHSHKANKREVVSELDRCLEEILVPQKSLADSEFWKISRLRNYLNKYVEALHKKYEPIKWSAYEIIGKLSKLQEFPYIPVEFDTEGLTPEGFLRIEDLIKRLKGVWKVAKEGDNFSWKDFCETKFTFTLKRKMLGLLEKLIAVAQTLTSVVIEYISKTELEHSENLIDIEWLVETSKFLKETPQPEPQWLTCSDIDFRQLIERTSRFQKIYDVYWKSKKFFETYDEEFFNLELKRLNKRFNGIYRKRYFRWLNPLYYWDKHLVASKTKARKFPSSFKNDLEKVLELKQYMNNIKSILPEGIPSLITNEGIINFERYVNKEESLQVQFGSYFRKLTTNWNEISNILKWTTKVRSLFAGKKMSINFVRLLCKEANITPICENLIQSYSEFKKYLNEFEGNFEADKEFNKLKLKELQSRLQYLIAHIDDLQIWLNFKSIEGQFGKTEFNSFFQQLVRKAPPMEHLIEIYHKSVYQTWLENVLVKDSCLGEFQRQYHEQEINEFRLLDTKLVNFSPFRVIEQVNRYKPSAIIDVSGSEIAILKQESVRIRRRMPIRGLFKRIPNLLFRLKPCLMMSPISVSQFLDPKLQFDLVIFDEASQICPEDSIGSIYRGKQLIVVGDDKQLPPTPFFQKQEAMEEEVDWDNFDDEVSIDVESILHQCVSIVLPQKMLRWHYRSKYESLIAFSNHWFYKDGLVTFPSPLENEISQVQFRYVQDGIYDRGKTRTNKREAEIVTDLVFEHFKKTPYKTLGVVTFNLQQMNAIYDEIERRLKENPEFEKFFKEDRLEGFFVKNLENVQGDERDVMLFSIGYGKDEQGNMTMGFGPLNKLGGEKRLNVAITRAREKVVIVSSIKAADIDLKKTKASGVLHLWHYLDYAERGRDSLKLETKWGGEPESPFEEDVANEIRRLGYEAIPQVGCSRYRIDIGVIEPAKPGHFLLGIECDGATYHSAHTARDRDRLRQQVLEKLGWQIHHIWSSEWLFGKELEIERLKRAIEKASEKNHNPFRTEEKPRQIKGSSIKIEENIKYEKVRSSDQIPGTIPYKTCNIKPITGEVSLNSQIERVVKKTIEIEGPIHMKFLAERTAKILNFACDKYFSEKVKRAVENLTKGNLFNKRLLKIKGDFLWPLSVINVPVRVPISHLSETFRPIEYIPTEEIQNAMLLIVKNSFGINVESLIDATVNLFGIKRKGGKIQNILHETYEKCVRKNLLSEKEGQVILGKEANLSLTEELQDRTKQKYSLEELKEIYKKSHPRS